MRNNFPRRLAAQQSVGQILRKHSGPRASPSRDPILALTTLGVLDLVTAVTLGAISAPGPIQIFGGAADTTLMTSLPWIFIPCFMVPTLFAVHLATFAKLRGEPVVRPIAPILA